ncbi:AAA family ATPase [Prevotella jejuni]|uniref:AAA family ATPase n=1 Tax=Prevotella jejuni TaxID=1177574 RepID=UPI00352F70CF
MSFTWVPYYKEFAEKLLQYQENRASLCRLIYDHEDELLINYLHDEGGKDDRFTDIDPFTTFGIFNRGISKKNRASSAALFKRLLNISAEVPSDFDGVPILNNQKSHFFGFRSDRKPDDIENLWRLFVKVVKKEDFENEYNALLGQFLIGVNITMALFWVRPEDFLAFDSSNRAYMKRRYGIVLPNRAPAYSAYMSILNDIKKKMKEGVIKEKTFCELSANAYNGALNGAGQTRYDDIVGIWRRRKNIVLHGAPGTGKTYDVPELAVRLCDPSFMSKGRSREEIVKRYNQLKDDERLTFTTFHQSLDYEDWIEGLRPVVNETSQVTYEIENGVFKRLCEAAERSKLEGNQYGISSESDVWKVSLKRTGDNDVRKDCMENDYIRIGWDAYGDEISDETDGSSRNDKGKKILNAYINRMKVGDIVMSCYSSKEIDAIGVITGDYRYDESLPAYKRIRPVRWLIKGKRENIVEINGGKEMVESTVYRLKSIHVEDVEAILEKYGVFIEQKEDDKPYVMVIDELNRGNVSKVFGELITLLEADKRKGSKNEESVKLPYSKKSFHVPDNVYLIATMNTADRSLGSLDYAIRRRFAFISERPIGLADDRFNAELFEKVSRLFVKNFDAYKASGWDATMRLLPADTLSDEYKPEDVWIGHSYFLMQDEEGVDNSRERILYELIPLLEEYVRDGVLTADAQAVIDELYKQATA